MLAALERLGRAARARTAATVIGVTGSAGKTTTKDALRHALAASGAVHAAERSYNNHWGVPLTLARMPADCDYAVFEIGMNHAGEISRLVDQVRPHIAIVTLIAAAHLGNFKSLDDIARAKAEIFEGVVPDGHALLNRDDQRWKLLDAAAKAAGVKQVWSFGQHQRATFKLLDYQEGEEGATMTVRMAGKTFPVRLGVPGRHIAQNALAVLGAAYLAGADVDKAAASLAGLSAGQGRGRRHRLAHPKGGAFTVIDESYNANPASMRAALLSLAATAVDEGGRRIAVLGDMLELGSHAARMHAGLADFVAEAGVDLVMMAGPEMKALAQKLPAEQAAEHFETVDALKAALLAGIAPGDAVMIKSSNAIGFSAVVEAVLKKYRAAPKPKARPEEEATGSAR